jgi:hypothetical protein
MAEPDLFFYFGLVEYYLKNHVWPTTDPFLYTLPNDVLMTAHQWLGYWIFYIPYYLFSWAGPILLKSFLVGTMLTVPLWAFWSRRKPLPTYFTLLWTLAILIGYHRFRERVSVFGDLFVVLLFFGLMFWRDRKWFWYSLPVMTLLWVQMHPSWPLEWAILGVFFLTTPPRNWKPHMLICSGLCLIMPVFNPLGLDGLFYPFDFALHIEPYLRQYIVEWLPLTDPRIFKHRFLYYPFYTMMPFVAWRLWSARKHVQVFEWCIFALFIALSVKSVRFGLLAEVIFLTMLVTQELRKPFELHPAWLKNIYVPAIAIACASIVYFKESADGFWKIPFTERMQIEKSYFPEAAVDALDKLKPKMHILNSFGFGGYLSWRWQGNPKIFFHGFSTNFAFYEENYIQPQLDPQKLKDLIRRYDIGVFLISKLGNDNPFIMYLKDNPDFQLIYNDPAAVIFVKRDRRVFE